MTQCEVDYYKNRFTQILITQAGAKDSAHWDLCQVALIRTDKRIKIEQSRLAVRSNCGHR